ncbi:uncharacterized protein LOC122251128 [Penaeus japonicus]|uniref:uncharacterized protein LOC122251128 n=1 Tax=Penaeus japonicus TaxID=27405 RepID=UPI001C71206B|nr:uncharacterized protein LOC122251128 [Penaeus japonicus]
MENEVKFAKSKRKKGKAAGKDAIMVAMLEALGEFAIEILVLRNVFLYFIGYEKAFDKVRYEDLRKTLEDLDTDKKEMRAVRYIYWNQKAVVRMQGGKTEYQTRRRGVWQGCAMSPDLSSLYGEIILRELQGLVSVKIGGYNVSHIRYVDDTVLVADPAEKLQLLLDVTIRASEEEGLTVNMDKTKCWLHLRQMHPE